jgi:hypothetical protein
VRRQICHCHHRISPFCAQTHETFSFDPRDLPCAKGACS